MLATDLHPVLRGSPYGGYVYAYPHKTAYRTLARRSLRDVWQRESHCGLFLYMHIPFCTMRCAFCNLFTTARPRDDLATSFLAALRRQAEVVRESIPDARFARFAIGGGTPTYLRENELEEVFDIAERVLGANPQTIPACVEVSPDTLTPEKAALLKARGIDRVSIGVQSFIESETAASGRPQARAAVDAALSLLSNADFPILNLDLIYGLPGQTVSSWLYSLQEALRYAPRELYLYPLYVRPLTGLGRSNREWDDIRLACYREARDVLLSAGYEQISMRMFHADEPVRSPHADCNNDLPLPRYCCQEDGMIGLGCGARSYTRDLHYSLDYAVQPKGVKEIIADYLARSRDELAEIEHGFILDEDEQRRRYLLQSILHRDGLDGSRYTARFGTTASDDFPDLAAFTELGLLEFDGGKWTPTQLGLGRSDMLGPWFFSNAVRKLMGEYEQK